MRGAPGSAMRMVRFAMGSLLLAAWLIPSLAWGQASPSDYTYAIRYDAAGRVVGTIAPDPDGSDLLLYAAVRDSCDAAGRLVKVEKGELSAWQSEAVAPANWPGFTVFSEVDTSWDAMDRKTVEQTVSGGTVFELTQYSYDAVGRLQCTAVRMNPAAYGSLPASACTLGTQGNFGPDRITQNSYDAAGQLLKVQKAVGTADQADDATYTYTPNGKVATMADADGNLASMSYDGFDRQSAWYFPSPGTAGQSSTTDYESYGYDANGNRTSFRRRDGRTLTYTYDALNRVTSKIVPDGCAPIQVGNCTPASATRDVYYGYDLRGLQTYARFDSASGDGVTSSYDGFGELIASTTAMAGTSRTLLFAYDADGNRIRITHPDGAYFRLGYDGLDRMDAASWSIGGVTTAFSNIIYRPTGLLRVIGYPQYSGNVFRFDGIDRPTTVLQEFYDYENDNEADLTYNAASQIVSETRSNDAFAWTGAVNIDRSYVVNGLNQYVTAGPATFVYDANANLIADGTNAYGYDAENRLVLASSGVSLTYDPLGRLWQTTGGSTGTTQFLYDGDELAAEFGGSGNLLRRYAWGPGTDRPILWDEGGRLDCTGTRFAQVDHDGSVVALGDCSGLLRSINSYDEYGIPGAGNVGRFQYTGQAWISELGMYYYKARLYSPTAGRFMQTDPIGYKDQNNLYEYVGDDPVNRTDPTGMDGACIYGPSQCSPQGPTLGEVIARDPIGAAINVATAVLVAIDVIDGPTPDVGAAALAARAARAERMAANAAQGARAEARTAARLGDSVAGRRVTLESSSTGRRSVTDFVTKDKGVVEAKSGGSPLRPGQRDVKADIDAGRPVTPRGQNARDAGLTPGEPTRMRCYQVDRCK